MREDRLATVVIPLWRDEAALTAALQRLPETSGVEIVVACSLGEESRYRSLQELHPRIRWISAPRGRASQMNAAAAIARGRWLLFLHADCVLPAPWLDVVAAADRRPDVVAGAFRFALDSRDWRARLIEAGVRLRVALLRLPYGDQALFVRRGAFAAIGGYRDLPLMEDVDLVRRISATGRVMHARAAVLTSARRWERDGWMRRSAQNAGLAARFLLGAAPARLAQRYFGRKAGALVMMARAPWSRGKTRLGVAADATAHAALRHALFLDTLDVLTSLRDVEHVIACDPPEACERMRELAGAGIDVIAQRGADLGQRLAHVFEDVFRLGAESVVVVGSDLPDLPSRILREAFSALEDRQDRIVIGPAGDGGYYLVGMKQPHPALFKDVDWSTDRVLAQTLDRARMDRVPVAMLEEWADVDDAADLSRVIDGSPTLTATRTRAWAAERSRPNAAALKTARHPREL